MCPLHVPWYREHADADCGGMTLLELPWSRRPGASCAGQPIGAVEPERMQGVAEELPRLHRAPRHPPRSVELVRKVVEVPDTDFLGGLCPLMLRLHASSLHCWREGRWPGEDPFRASGSPLDWRHPRGQAPVPRAKRNRRRRCRRPPCWQVAQGARRGSQDRRAGRLAAGTEMSSRCSLATAGAVGHLQGRRGTSAACPVLARVSCAPGHPLLSSCMASAAAGVSADSSVEDDGSTTEAYKKGMWEGKSNIMVCVRVRPLSEKERRSSKDTVRVVEGHMVVCLDPGRSASDVLRKGRSRERQYAFDHAYGPDVATTTIYSQTTQFLLDGALSRRETGVGDPKRVR